VQRAAATLAQEMENAATVMMLTREVVIFISIYL